MKLITLTTCSLIPIYINQNIFYTQKNENQLKKLQEKIKNQNYVNKFNDVDYAWKKVLSKKKDQLKYDGIFIEPVYFNRFYDKFKIFLDHTNDIFRKFENVEIIKKNDIKLDQIFILHRKNPIDFTDMDWLQMFKKTEKLFINLEKAWNMAQEIYNDLNKIIKFWQIREKLIFY